MSRAVPAALSIAFAGCALMNAASDPPQDAAAAFDAAAGDASGDAALDAESLDAAADVELGDAGPDAADSCSGTVCGEVCADLESDESNCGGCDDPCIDGACVDGGCTCEEPMTLCERTCAQLDRDRAHCGDCDIACGGEDLCLRSECCGGTAPDPHTWAEAVWSCDEGMGRLLGNTASDDLDGELGDPDQPFLDSPPEWIDDGRFGGALSFSPSDFVGVVVNGSIDFPSSSFSVEAWVRPRSLPVEGGAAFFILAWPEGETVSYSFALGIFNDSDGVDSAILEFSFVLPEPDGLVALRWAETASLLDDQWHQVVGVLDDSTSTEQDEARLYVDGTLVVSANLDVNAGDLAPATGYTLGYGLDGDLDDVRLTAWPLEDPDVAASYCTTAD